MNNRSMTLQNDFNFFVISCRNLSNSWISNKTMLKRNFVFSKKNNLCNDYHSHLERWKSENNFSIILDDLLRS